MGQSLLAKYNSEFKNSMKPMVEEAKAEVKDNSIQKYENILASGDTMLDIVFDYADEEGNLIYTDENGIRIIMTDEGFDREIYGTNKDKKLKKDGLVGLRIHSVIDRVDKENNIVYLKNAQSRNDIKGAVIKAIYKELRAGKNPVLWGDVVTVSDKVATVNILHKNVLGILRAKDYAPNFIRSLRTVVHVGDAVQFEITGEAPRRAGKEQAFMVSRRKISKDAWKVIPEYKEGEVIVLKCVDKPAGKTFFWGSFGGAKGIDILCDYNSRFNIVKGASYKAKVVEFNRENHVFKASPFEIVASPVGTLKNVDYIQRRGV